MKRALLFLSMAGGLNSAEFRVGWTAGDDVGAGPSVYQYQVWKQDLVNGDTMLASTDAETLSAAMSLPAGRHLIYAVAVGEDMILPDAPATSLSVTVHRVVLEAGDGNAWEEKAAIEEVEVEPRRFYRLRFTSEN
jgi:hypothetical protein